MSGPDGWTVGGVERVVLRAMLYYVVAAGLYRLPLPEGPRSDISREKAALAVCTVVAVAGLAISSSGNRPRPGPAGREGSSRSLRVKGPPTGPGPPGRPG